MEDVDIRKAKDAYIRLIEGKKLKVNLTRAKQLPCPNATLTLDEWLEILHQWGFTCAYCASEYAVLEHYIPISRGGGTTSYNCVPACYRCNKLKDDRRPEDILKNPPPEHGPERAFYDAIKRVGEVLQKKFEELMDAEWKEQSLSYRVDQKIFWTLYDRLEELEVIPRGNLGDPTCLKIRDIACDIYEAIRLEGVEIDAPEYDKSKWGRS